MKGKKKKKTLLLKQKCEGYDGTSTSREGKKCQSYEGTSVSQEAKCNCL